MKILSDILRNLYSANWFDPVFPERDFANDLQPRSINAAFLVALAGEKHKRYAEAVHLLNSQSGNDLCALFFREGLDRIHSEIENLVHSDPVFRDRIQILANWCTSADNLANRDATQERIWSVFFPEAQGIKGNEETLIQDLRYRRKIELRDENKRKGIEPASQLLFTSNVLLTPPITRTHSDLHLSQNIKTALDSVIHEKQKFWYDHPIPVGIKPSQNEFIYGIQGLDQALEFEIQRGNLAGDDRIPCIVSASVTHTGLHTLVKEYLLDTLQESGGLKHINLHVFTENDCQAIIKEVLVPASSFVLRERPSASTFSMLGVDGEYGRHYSFLKAISAFWHVFIDPHIRATFKIDLDQVFPQENLVAETGASMFEHFQTLLWGAKGEDERGIHHEFGMIAGALVNQSDIDKSLFTPDVKFPVESLTPDESIFYSALPQALSTEAEMMTRYRPGNKYDGTKTCIQRVHVTGGTNGILVDSLFKFKPFTPSFIGRAEDQAYIMSAYDNQTGRLAYLHKDGLIMRHDKHSFAQEAMQAAEIGKLIGDYTRILVFSKYAHLITNDFKNLKNFLDPFTGCFISQLPITVTLLRFALKAGFLFAQNQTQKAEEFIKSGTERLSAILTFTDGNNAQIHKIYAQEKKGWENYYSILKKMKQSLERKDPGAEKIARTARKIVNNCHIK